MLTVAREKTASNISISVDKPKALAAAETELTEVRIKIASLNAAIGNADRALSPGTVDGPVGEARTRMQTSRDESSVQLAEAQRRASDLNSVIALHRPAHAATVRAAVAPQRGAAARRTVDALREFERARADLAATDNALMAVHIEPKKVPALPFFNNVVAALETIAAEAK